MEDIYHTEDWISLAWNMFLLFVFLDIVSCIAWHASGQVPESSFCFGALSDHVLNFILR